LSSSFEIKYQIVASYFLVLSVQGNFFGIDFKLATGSQTFIKEKVIKSFVASQIDFPAENESNILLSSFHHNQSFEKNCSYQNSKEFQK
jgi:hypothetical protein